MTYTLETLNVDAKLVYNGTVDDLVDLATKYNVTTKSLTYARAYFPEERNTRVFASIGNMAFKTNSDAREIQSKLYATIKSEIRKAS